MLDRHFNSGANAQTREGKAPTIPALLDGITGYTLAQAKAIPPRGRDAYAGFPIYIGGAPWTWNTTCELTGDDVLIATPDDAPDAGRFLRLPGFCVLSFAFTFAKADAAAHYTMPTGAVLLPTDYFWTVTAGFTGGSSSTIGASSNKADGAVYTTKGDLLGGAAGDVAATLVAGTHIAGTIGAKWDALAERRAFWIAGNTFRHDRITSAFTAGAGSFNVVGHLLRNAGA